MRVSKVKSKKRKVKSSKCIIGQVIYSQMCRVKNKTLTQ